jgi:hypothetical protein
MAAHPRAVLCLALLLLAGSGSATGRADEAAPRVASGRAADIGHEDGGTASKGGEQHDAARKLDASDAVATRRRLSDCPAGKISAPRDSWPGGWETVDVDASWGWISELQPPVNYELSFTIKIDDSGLW